MATKKKSTGNPLQKKTEWTINEFKMWLHGAYSLQGDDWVPNAEQWAMILDIIYKLKDGNKGAAPPSRITAPPGYGGPALPLPAPVATGSSFLNNVTDDTIEQPVRSPPTGNGQSGIPTGEKILQTGQFD